MCPVCGSLERHRLAVMYLRRRRDLLRNLDRVLHIAPERPVARVLQDECSEAYVTADLDADGVMVQADLTRIPFDSESFDCLFCSHVLEHVPDDRRAMKELHRVLRPGGWALLQVPIRDGATFEDPTVEDPERRAELFGQPDHVRVYGHDFKDRLEAARFSVSVERPQESFDRDVLVRCGLRTPERIFVCRRDG